MGYTADVTSQQRGTAQDPWAHRATHMKCKSCMWYAPKGEGEIGRCRRHAPTLGGYPVVFETDWCGDHKLDEVRHAVSK